MERSSGENASDALRVKLEEQKQTEEEQAAMDKKFSIPPAVLKQSCSELYHIHK